MRRPAPLKFMCRATLAAPAADVVGILRAQSALNRESWVAPAEFLEFSVPPKPIYSEQGFSRFSFGFSLPDKIEMADTGAEHLMASRDVPMDSPDIARMWAECWRPGQL